MAQEQNRSCGLQRGEDGAQLSTKKLTIAKGRISKKRSSAFQGMEKPQLPAKRLENCEILPAIQIG
jgi:hypothetical protein